MKRSRFTEEQIAAILKQGEAGMKTAELCRQNGISEATYYNWKAKYGGLAVSDVQRAVTTLLRVMADPAAAAASRVRAASQVLEISVRAMELDDLEGRIARLERDQETRQE